MALVRDAQAADRAAIDDDRARVDAIELIELVVRAQHVRVVGLVERRAVVGEERVVAARALIAERRRRLDALAVAIAVVQPQVTRTVRAGTDRRADALAALAATEPRDEVERTADACTAELDGHRAAIELDLAERIEREAAEIRA